MDEFSYVRFNRDAYGFKSGEVVAVSILKRDHLGIQIALRPRGDGSSDPFNAWSDLGGFIEVDAMEVVALAAAGRLPD